MLFPGREEYHHSRFNFYLFVLSAHQPPAFGNEQDLFGSMGMHFRPASGAERHYTDAKLFCIFTPQKEPCLDFTAGEQRSVGGYTGSTSAGLTTFINILPPEYYFSSEEKKRN